MTAKQTFNRIGWALCAAVGSLIAVQIALNAILRVSGLVAPESEGVGWVGWLASFLPVYACALPLGYCLLRRVPAEGHDGTPLGGKNFLVFLLMCFPLMYAGNLIGTLLSALLSGGAAENPLLGFAFDDNPIKLLVMVVLAPLFEEWFFRKQLIDHSARYGEKTAILLSALAFALFHGNLYQLFYAFALGLLFAYVYVRTRRLRYPVLLHMIVNFMGTVVGPLVLSAVDMEALEQVQSGAMDEAALTALLPGVGVLMLYGLVIIGLSIAGLVLLILRAHRLVFLPAEEELPKEGRFQTVYANAGMILYALLCIGLCVASLFLS